jgi:uncharacterized protein YPO0396
MELLNWGTFDGRVFKIKPEGNNSLLTGANGSGKTTFVDALLTLLVPLKNDRFYNQSSGVEKKGDRDEESYVLGHYGDILKEGDLSTTTQKLRDKNSYSILLATFTNTDDKVVTLFQVRWFSGGVMKRSFGIAHIKLTIEDDFGQFDEKSQWKRYLDQKHNLNSIKNKIEYFDGPTKYAKRMVGLFGMRSIKALSLFNQVVGIKVLGDLDEFIRTNMLESRDAEAEYVKLKESFITLTDAKNNIDKAKEQIEQLTPINELANQLKANKDRLTELEKSRDIAVLWFATKGFVLSEQEEENLLDKRKKLNTRLEELKTDEDRLRGEKEDVAIRIKSDEVSGQIESLKNNIKENEKIRDIRKNALKSYNSVIQNVNLQINPSEKQFNKNVEDAKKLFQGTEQDREALDEEKRLAKNKDEAIGIQIEEAISAVAILKNNKNNIPHRVATIRENILKAVGATKDEIPFIGELIKINEGENAWEAAIEKLLHNFALRIIVPEKYYSKVNEYVNKTNLKGRITYQRYKPSFSVQQMSHSTSGNDVVVSKLTFKFNNEYSIWIENTVLDRFNFKCADNLDAFAKAERAITKSGIIKFGKGRHEKDDRKHVLSKENYILGWDNTEKLNWWRQQVLQFQKEKEQAVDAIRAIEKKLKKANSNRDDYREVFKTYTNFEQIDWNTCAIKIESNKTRILELEKTNDKARALQKEKETIEASIKKVEEEKTKKSEDVFNINRNLKDLKTEINKHKTIVDSFIDKTEELLSFETTYPQLTETTFATFNKTQSKFQKENSVELTNLKDENSKLSNNLANKMRVFKFPPENITTKFTSWRSDVSKLTETVDYVAEYQNLYEKLVEDDLPRFQTKFNDYLEETINDKVGAFNFFFDRWSNEIKQNVTSLNDALKEIDFKSPPDTTYIQLVAPGKRDDTITEFRKLLDNAIPDFREISASIDGKRLHFENHIEPLIEQLQDEKWREKVMDVRSWFEYKAEEFYRESDQKFKTYESMGQLSGGEKAQLTYTILGSAIAYQFGLTKEGTESNSFRFIAIDEAFKAQDSDKADYLMQLCKQLHLQLLVVTPSDNIEIVEPHISFVHFAARINDTNSWLYDMPIQQFQEEREKYRQLND